MSPPKTSLDSKYQIETSHHRCLSCEAELPRGEPHYSVVIATGESLARKDFCLPCWESLPRQKGPPRIELPAGGERPATALEFYAFWKTRRPQGPSGGRLRFDSEVVLDFFRHLADDQPVEETAADGEPAPSAPAETQAEALAPAGATASPAGATGGAGEPAGPSTSTGLNSRQRRDLCFVLCLLLLRKKVLQFVTSGLENGREWLKLSERREPDRDYWVENPELSDDELERVRDELGELLEMKF